jgi:DNA-binding HxlR family transcriptional regulator
MKLEKITAKVPRRYEDACGTAHALDLLGERWALLIVRELMFGPRRFGDLRASLPGLSANVLTQRLEGLEATGVLRRRKLPPPALVQVYELTAWGREAEPILLSLGVWAIRSPWHDTTQDLSPVALMLSFRAKFDAGRAAGMATRVAFRFHNDAFGVVVRDGVMTIERGELAEPDVEVIGPPKLVAAMIYGKVPPEALVEAGLSISGDGAAFQRFADLFEMPPKADAPA